MDVKKIWQLLKWLKIHTFSPAVSRQAGVFFSGETLFVVILEESADKVQVLQWERLLTEPGEWAEQLVLFLKRNGYDGCPVMLSLPETVILQAQIPFPKMKEAELQAAVVWELEELFPPAAGGYAYRAWYHQEKEAVACIAALPKEQLRAYETQAAGMELSLVALLPAADVEMETIGKQWSFFSKAQARRVLVVPSDDVLLEEGGRQAIWAGCYQQNKTSIPNLLEQSAKPGEAKEKALVFILLFLCVLAGGICLGSWLQLNQLEEKIEIQQQQLTLLAPAMAKRTAWDEEVQNATQAYRILENLSKSNVSAVAVLTELGFLKLENLHLHGLVLTEKKQLELEGQADDFAGLAAFIQTAGDAQMFSEASLLYSENINDGEHTGVRFRIRLLVGERREADEAQTEPKDQL